MTKFDLKGYTAAEKVEILISEMTLEEKVAQLGSVGPDKIMEAGKFSQQKAEKYLKNGIGQITRIAGASALEPEKAAELANQVQKYLAEETRLGIPALIHEECLSGYMGKGGTTFPQSIGIASSWEPELLKRQTDVIRKQLRSIGAHLALSPVADVARDLRWGRVEETFGEDPYLVAEMVNAYVAGLQGEKLSEGIIATLKHFAGHSYSEGGRNHAPVNLSERELRETFLFPFEAAIKTAKAGSVMNAYHDIDGIPCAASRQLLTDILRGEWGFDGIVVSDYWSIKMLYNEHKIAVDLQEAGIKALSAGLDIELPETECYGHNLVKAVKEGLISEKIIDQAVSRHLLTKFKTNIFEKRYVNTDQINSLFETPAQRELARESSRKTMVLLKNESAILPLSKQIESIALIGPSAASTRNLLGDYAYSAHVDSKEDAVDIVSIMAGIKAKISSETKLNYAAGCNIMDQNKDGFSQAVKAAQASQVAVVVVGGKSGLSGMGENENSEDEVVDFEGGAFLSELQNTTDTTGEHHDRTSLNLPGVQEELVKEIVKTGTPVIVVFVNGRPLSSQWIAENAAAILEAWLPGEEGGNGVADILFGDYNPGGKLPVSIPKNVGQLPIHYNRRHMSHYRDYVFTGNRPLYPFGFGLSYTEFAYANLQISPQKFSGNSEITIQAEIENIGQCSGTEVVQLYVQDKIASLTRPLKSLKGFKRVELAAGEKKRISFILKAEQLAFYDKDMNLVVEPGEFEFMLGSSSTDIRLTNLVELIGDKIELTAERNFFSKVKLN
ncbi:glycoside hydrolase family 3 N-terminal domain-containing protein [Halanaerobium salsuginis]|uniref:Beta-glucosidase n=1 Tax=Halanaerobium salsuginis TaxID=29563 RepID=A0A1I4K1N3_9FIRM|nr:glycoside hydrolase family 3 N-terminal domain-containing protein [Halanaerobium salsuginis]SFL72497.1 beta-glucosidase [Halanaerobium salsuginis]